MRLPGMAIDEGATQMSHDLSQIFTLAQKSLKGSHEEALNLMTEKLEVASAMEIQALQLRTENARLRAALDQQPSIDQPFVGQQSSDLRAALELHRPPKISELHRISPPGEAPPALMDISTASSSPMRLPGMAIDEGCENIVSVKYGCSSTEVRHESSCMSASPSLQSVQRELSIGFQCAKCGSSYLSDSTFCHKCGLKRTIARKASNKELSLVRPNQFQLLPIWTQSEGRDSGNHSSVARDLVLYHGNMGFTLPSEGRNGVLSKSLAMDPNARLNLYAAETEVIPFFANGILHPSSTIRGTWDLASLVLVTYDIIMIPLDSFFEPPQSAFTVLSSWIVRLFWSSDIVFSFITGYYERDGSIILDRWKIIRRYLVSWFVLDCLVVGVDWIELIAQSFSGEVGYARIGKVGRSFRIIRMVRLLRLVRMREIVDLILERINSEKLLLLAHITKLMVVMLMVAHIVACLWYGVGSTGSPNTWVTHYSFAEKPWGDRYAMSLHWSVSQFAGGMDEITPENPGERVFAMIVLMLTFIMAALFISSLTSSMTQLELLGSTNSQLLSGLRQYLHQRKISSKLSMRVQRNAQHQMKEQARNMPEDKIDLLTKISEPLLIELHFEIYSPAFNCHPFFKRYIKECPQVMRKVCHTAARSVSVSAGDGIFSAGTSPAQPQMYFITDGSLEYMSKALVTTTHDDHNIELQKGEWIAEAVLWVVWMYRGDLIARANSSYCMLDALQFQDTVNEFHHHSTIAKAYAEKFVTRLNRIGANVSDLHIHSDEEIHPKQRRSLFHSFRGGETSSPLSPSMFADSKDLTVSAPRPTAVAQGAESSSPVSVRFLENKEAALSPHRPTLVP